MPGLNRVLYNVDQRNDTTAAEKATARANIGAQGALTAGQNITISNGVISAANTEYQAGHGLTLSNNTFAVDDTVLQGKLTAGANIQLNGNTISATDTTYTAGSGLALNGNEFSNTAPNVKSDWNAAAGSDAEILNKPTIPTVNDGTLTIQKNGTNVATFSANQSSAATANITVPTDTSDLTNGAGFITASQIPAHVNADWNASSGSAEILNKPNLQYKPYGGTAGNMTSLLLDADDPEGYVDLGVNGGSLGQLVAGPYSTLLNSGVNGVGDSTHGIYIDSNGEFAQGNAVGSTVETTSSPYSTSTAQSRVTIFDPGSDFGSLVKDTQSNSIGFLLPKHYGQNDLGKVPTVVNDSGYKIEWRTPTSGYPQIEYMGHTSYYADLTQANYLYMEDGVCYDIMTNAGGNFTLHLMTNSTTTIHSKIYLWGELANCVFATIVYEDEGGEVSQLQFTYGDMTENTIFALDVFARKVHVSGGISFDTTLCRVYDYPCASRDTYSHNEDMGRIVEYIEPL